MVSLEASVEYVASPRDAFKDGQTFFRVSANDEPAEPVNLLEGIHFSLEGEADANSPSASEIRRQNDDSRRPSRVRMFLQSPSEFSFGSQDYDSFASQRRVLQAPASRTRKSSLKWDGRLASTGSATYSETVAAAPMRKTFEDHVRSLQLRARRNVLCKQKLHRENLANRIVFERKLVIGGFRLLTQCMIFTLLITSLYLAGDSQTKRGILNSLNTHFGFEELAMTPDTNSFVSSTMKNIASRSKDFFVLSSKYFVPDGGSVELLSEKVTFTAPKLLSKLELSVQVPSFSFSAWVRTGAQYTNGYIVRKRIIPAGDGTELACWGWHLSDVLGPSLHYGAHDFFSVQHMLDATQRQEQVGLPEPAAVPALEFALLTMVVEYGEGEWQVHFYRNLERQGVGRLPRPLTDCFNNQEGVLVGDPGLTIGQLNFYPRALTASAIEEIFRGGATLADISTGSTPTKAGDSELVVVGRELEAGMLQVGQAVAEQLPLAEVNLVLQAVDAALRDHTPHDTAPPSAPTGMLPVDPTLRRDETGREYTQLVEGPYRMSRPAAGEERYFDPEAFPTWAGTGMSVTLWYRQAECEHASCGTYIISAHPDGGVSGRRCWNAWIENEAVYFDYVNHDEEYTSHYAQHIMPPKFQVGNNHWRHIAFVWDVDTDHWLFYQDGELVYRKEWGSSVAETDARCDGPLKRVTLFARFPGWTYGRTDDVFDMRIYVGRAVSPSEMRAIAAAATPQLGTLHLPRAEGETAEAWAGRGVAMQHLYRCTPLDSEQMMDSSWRDIYGHGCEWYFNTVKHTPRVCLLPEAQANCPVACKSLQECFSDAEARSPPHYFVWDSIRRLEARSRNGTLCLATHRDPAAVVADCERWMASREWFNQSGQWRLDLADALGRRLNFTDCAELAAAINPHCSFDADAVRRFTADVKAGGGDYTVGFWVKALGEASLLPDGRFTPHLGFTATVSPPQQPISIAQYTTGLTGEVRSRTACRTAFWSYENVEIRQAASDGWTFVSWSRVNTTGLTAGGVQGYSATNLAGMFESAGNFFECLFDDDLMFQALEINYPMLISPILLVPQALPFATIQELYYSRVNHMRILDGPIVPEESRNRTRIPVVKEDYFEQLVLLASPLIFSTRNRPTVECPSDTARSWLQDQHELMVETRCAAPYTCPPDILTSPEATMACAGDSADNETFFGLLPIDFKGLGYADLLYSITDAPFVSRSGQLRSTRDFVDSHTEMVSITMVFFAPQYGITSVMEVVAYMAGPGGEFSVETKVEHYSIVEGQRLWVIAGIQALVILTVCVNIADIVLNQNETIKELEKAKRTLSKNRKRHKARVQRLMVVGAVVMGAAVVVGVSLHFSSLLQSASFTNRILADLKAIPWASSTVAMQEKKSTFFQTIQALIARIHQNERFESFLNILLLLNLIRCIQNTSIHPRLALLTGTFTRALDDFWHSFILIAGLMIGFACIGTWRFGDEMEAFATLDRALQTEFFLMFGEFMDGWAEGRELQLFIVLWYMLSFLLVLNFLLAIVVESYMEVRKRNIDIVYEGEFFSDLSGALAAQTLRWWHRWPPPEELAGRMAELRAKLTVGFQELSDSGLFPTQPSLAAFLRFYERFVFLEPPVLLRGRVQRVTQKKDRLNAQVHKEEMIADKVEQRLARLLNIKVPSYRDLAQRSGSLVSVISNNHTESMASLVRPSRSRTGSVSGALLDRDADEAPDGVPRSWGARSRLVQRAVSFTKAGLAPTHTGPNDSPLSRRSTSQALGPRPPPPLADVSPWDEEGVPDLKESVRESEHWSGVSADKVAAQHSATQDSSTETPQGQTDQSGSNSSPDCTEIPPADIPPWAHGLQA